MSVSVYKSWVVFAMINKIWKIVFLISCITTKTTCVFKLRPLDKDRLIEAKKKSKFGNYSFQILPSTSLLALKTSFFIAYSSPLNAAKPWWVQSNTWNLRLTNSDRTRKFQKETLCTAVQCFNNKKLGFLTEKTCSIFFSEDSHNTQRTHFWCVSGWIYAIQLSDKDCEVLCIISFHYRRGIVSSHSHSALCNI